MALCYLLPKLDNHQRFPPLCPYPPWWVGRWWFGILLHKLHQMSPRLMQWLPLSLHDWMRLADEMVKNQVCTLNGKHPKIYFTIYVLYKCSTHFDRIQRYINSVWSIVSNSKLGPISGYYRHDMYVCMYVCIFY